MKLKMEIPLFYVPIPNIIIDYRGAAVKKLMVLKKLQSLSPKPPANPKGWLEASFFVNRRILKRLKALIKGHITANTNLVGGDFALKKVG